MRNEIRLAWLADEIKKEYPQIELFPADMSRFHFERRVKMNCFYCKNYGLNWKCPPKIPDIDYQKMMCEYDHGAFVKIELPFQPDDFQEIRARTTNDLHQALLKLEKILWEQNQPMAISFIGGSCKLCKNGCGPDRCSHPYESRVPFEASGVNVVKTVEEQTEIRLSFPPKNTLKRVGLLLW